MMDVQFLDQAGAAALVPECYAAFRPMVAEAIRFFVEHLSQERLTGILLDQASLPADADISTRLVHFMHACPALHKIGQVVARDRRLDSDFRRRLQRLETMQPRTPMAVLRPILDRELRPFVDRYGIEISETPLAEASVAVVVPCTWSDPKSSRSPRQHGVLKILRPGVQRDLDEDLTIIGRLADEMDARSHCGELPPLAYRDVLDEVRSLLLHEIQVDREQRNLAAAGTRFAANRDVLVPSLLPFSTPNITAMQRVFGTKVTDLPARDSRRRRLAQTIARSLMAGVILSPDRQTVFHADPHAGNLFAADDGRLAILDWSLTGRISRDDLTALAQISLAAIARDAARVGSAVDRLASSPPPEQVVTHHVDRAIGALSPLTLPGLRWAMQLLDNLGLAGVRFPPDLMLLRKAYFTLDGVIGDVCGDCSLEQIMTVAMVEQFILESPARLMFPLDRPHYPTHISNADLIQLFSEIPMTLGRSWLQTCHDWARPG